VAGNLTSWPAPVIYFEQLSQEFIAWDFCFYMTLCYIDLGEEGESKSLRSGGLKLKTSEL
jgi:hypothetical protein